MRKILVWLILFVATAVLPHAATAQENWVINNVASDITLQADGKVKVVETIDVDFGSLQKHGIFRDIPYVYEDASGSRTYTEIDVMSVNTRYDIEMNSANMRLRIGDPDKTISGKQSYRIEYVMTGILRPFADYDELYWNVTGNEWEVPIQAASAMVTLSGPEIRQVSCYVGAFGETNQCSSNHSTTTAHFSTSQLEYGEGLTIAVGYTKGIVPILTVAAPPSPVDAATSPWAWGSFLIVFLGGAMLIMRQWFRYGRDQWWQRKNLHDPDATITTMPFFAKETISPEYEPPGGLRPAEIGVLVDEQADTLDVSATIVDLAVRGYLTIKEQPKKWLFGSVDYVFTRTKKDDADLLSYEQTLLNALFTGSSEVSLSSLKNKFHDDLAKVKEQLYSEVTKKKLFTKNPNSVRNTYLTIYGVVFVIGLLLSIFGIAGVMALPLGIGQALMLLGILAFIMAFGMPSRTATGRELYRQSLGYKLFVSGTEKYRQPFFEKENIFMEVLPYAIVFGVTKKLAEAMKDMGLKPPQPTWYVGTHPFNVAAFSSNMDSFSHSLSSVIASTPSSSGSGGGGFSGGGFGGGGGGSW